MARQVSEVLIRLGLSGFSELERIKSSFRDLGKVTQMAEADILSARDSLLEYARRAGNTEAVNKGLTSAFSALLDQAKRGSDVWKQLNTDLTKLRQESRLTDTQITALRDIIVDESKAHAQSANSIREHVKSLQDLRNQASLNGKVHQQLGADIQKLTDTLKQGEIPNREHYKSLGQILAVKPDAVLKQWQAYTRILQEGTASADKLATAQRRLNQLSGAPRILERRRVSESAAITQDPEYLRRFGFEGSSLPELPNTNAAYAQQIKELQQDLANLNRNSVEYLQTLMQLAGVQRQSTEVARGYAQALLMGIQTKTVASSTRNLQEVIVALRAEMQQLDVTTSEGSAAYATNASQVRVLEKQLNDLAGAYRHVGDMATQAATAEQNAANARIRDNYLNRGMVRQQEAAFAELGQRVRQGVSGTPLLLPAAGQTSAPGTGLNVSGGANVRLGGRRSVTDVGGNIPVMGVMPGAGVQRFFGSRDIGAAALYPGAVPIGPPMTSEQEGKNRTRVLSELSQAYDGLGRSTERARRPIREIYKDMTSATSASNGSLNSLRRQAELWGELRNAVNPLAPLYRKAGVELDRLNGRIERLERSRQKLSGMQIAQGVGAALSGGIFGGPEGLIGGLGGLAFGGVGGAFAGAAFGAQVGMFRQQLSATTDYSARIDKLQIALRGIVGSQAAYNQALAAASSVTRDLNVPQETAIQGMTRLSAAVLGAGGKVSDSAFAFRAISEAIKATGGNAEQVDGALLALTQVFSKGKVSAEELNQIAERLPGTFTLFAKAAGMTGPELQKALQDGKVGLNDLMKFLQLVSTNYGQTALKIAKSSQEAGARLTVAFQNMQLEVGRALQPIGSNLQNAFAVFLTDITPAIVATAKGFVALANAIGDALSAFMDFTAPVRNFFAVGIPAYLQVASAFWASIKNDIDAFWSRIGNVFKGLRNISYTVLKAIGLDFNNLDGGMRVVATTTAKVWSYAFGIIQSRWRSTVSNMINYSNPLLAALKLLGIADVGKAVTKGIEEGKAALTEALTIPEGKTPTKAQLSVFPMPAQDNKAAKARDKALRAAQALAAEQQRLANEVFEARLRNETAVFQRGIELDRQRYEQQKRLNDLDAQDRLSKMSGLGRTFLSSVYTLQQGLQEIEQRRRSYAEAADKAALERSQAQRRAVFAAEGATRLGSGAMQGVYRQGNIGPTSTGPHFHVMRSDGTYFPRNYLDQFVRVNGGPLSAGRTVPGGEYGAPRSYGPHSGRDYAFGKDAALMLTGGARFVSTKRGTPNGDETAFVTPDGKVFKILHGKFEPAPAPITLPQPANNIVRRSPPGAAQQQRLAAKTAGAATTEELQLDTAKAAQKLFEQDAPAERAKLYRKFITDITESLTQENRTIREGNELQLLRNRLNLEGASPELIALRERELQISRDRTLAQEAYNIALSDPNIDKQKLADALYRVNQELDTQVRLLQDAAAAQTAFNNSVGKGIRTGAANYVQSIGTMREATAQLTQTGIKGVEDAIFSLVTTGTVNFQAFAASILQDTARMIIQQLVLKSLLQAIGAIGGGLSGGGGGGGGFGPGYFDPITGLGAAGPNFGFAKGGIFAANGIAPYAMGGMFQRGVTAYAMGGIVDKPTLFKFADGGVGRTGLMGEAGPEAIMPLRRLPSGRLGVEQAGGAGTTNIVVNVDAKSTTASGDESKGKQLATAVSLAVQAELVRQQRPGGLLAK